MDDSKVQLCERMALSGLLSFRRMETTNTRLSSGMQLLMRKVVDTELKSYVQKVLEEILSSGVANP